MTQTIYETFLKYGFRKEAETLCRKNKPALGRYIALADRILFIPVSRRTDYDQRLLSESLVAINSELRGLSELKGDKGKRARQLETELSERLDLDKIELTNGGRGDGSEK